MSNIFNIYISKYQLLEEEKYLLYHKLCKIHKLNLSNNEILNMKEVSDKINYLKKINLFLKDNVK
jgi:hypothetical protein